MLDTVGQRVDAAPALGKDFPQRLSKMRDIITYDLNVAALSRPEAEVVRTAIYMCVIAKQAKGKLKERDVPRVRSLVHECCEQHESRYSSVHLEDYAQCVPRRQVSPRPAMCDCRTPPAGNAPGKPMAVPGAKSGNRSGEIIRLRQECRRYR